MKKTGTILVLVGGLVAVGMILSLYGSQVITEDLIQVDGNIGNGESIEAIVELDPAINDVGVYVVQTMNFNQGDISVQIFDPSGSQIISKTVEIESHEEQFDISSKGSFRLIIENAGDNTEIIGVIGHLPDTAKFSIGVIGFYLLLVGFFGMVGLGINVVINRRKN